MSKLTYRTNTDKSRIEIDGVSFTLKPLGSSYGAHIQAEADGSAALAAMLFVAFALEAVDGLQDEEGRAVQPQFEDVVVTGRRERRVAVAWLDGLPYSVVDRLAVEAVRLSGGEVG